MKFESFFPYAAGSPPAVVLGINLYNAIVSAAGAQFWIIAAPVALMGVAGMIATEVYTYQMAARAFAVKAWGAFLLALVGAALCSGFVIFGVYSGVNARSLISNTVIAIAAYLALAIKKYLDTLQEGAVSGHNQTMETMKAKKNLLNAETRNKNAGGATVQAAVQRPAAGGGQFATDPALIATIRAYWKTHPSASLREAAVVCKCSPTTAGKYKAAI